MTGHSWRSLYLLVAVTASVASGVQVMIAVPRLLVWNATPSVPVGLYLVVPVPRLRLGDLVLVAPTERFADFASGRGYLPKGLPLIKRVAALEGQEICRSRDLVLIDGRPVASARAFDRHARPLPVWSGCRRLQDEQLFLLNADIPDSLDGRYFGPTDRAFVLGRATLLVAGRSGLRRGASARPHLPTRAPGADRARAFPSPTNWRQTP